MPPAPKFDTAENIPTVAKLNRRKGINGNLKGRWTTNADQVTPTNTTWVMGDLSLV